MSSVNPYSAPEIEEFIPVHVPLSLGGTLSTAITIYFGRFVTIGLVILAVWLPTELLTSYLTYEVISEDFQTWAFLGNSIAELIVGTLVTATVVHLTYASLHSQVISFGQAMMNAVSAWPLLLLNQLIVGLIVTGAFMLLVIPGIYVTIRVCLVDSITVMERRSGTWAISRSFELTRDHFWFVFSVQVVCGLSSLVAYAVITTLQVYFEEINTWYIDGMLTTVYDFLTAFYTVCMVIIWNDLTRKPD